MFLAALSVVSSSLQSVSHFVLSAYSSPCCLLLNLVVYAVFHIHGWLCLLFLSFVTVFRFLFVFGSTVLLLFALISYFIGHASYSVFALFADQSAVVHFFLDPSQFLSSIFMRSYCRLRQLCWDCFHT